MNGPGSSATRPSRRKIGHRAPRIELSQWTRNHLAAVGATVKFKLHLPIVAPPPDLLDAIRNVACPWSDTFACKDQEAHDLRWIAIAAYRLTQLSPTPYDIERRRNVCTELINEVLIYLCPGYRF